MTTGRVAALAAAAFLMMGSMVFWTRTMHARASAVRDHVLSASRVSWTEHEAVFEDQDLLMRGSSHSPQSTPVMKDVHNYQERALRAEASLVRLQASLDTLQVKLSWPQNFPHNGKITKGSNRATLT